MKDTTRKAMKALIDSVERLMIHDISIPTAIGRRQWNELEENLVEARLTLAQEVEPCNHRYRLIERRKNGVLIAFDRCTKCGYEYQASLG